MEKLFDATALGEILIDFTECGVSANGRRLYQQNPGGAVANVMYTMSKLGAKTSFIGKVGRDVHGEYLKETLKRVGVNTDGLVLDPNVFTTLAFVTLSDKKKPSFSFARKPGADTQLQKPEVNKEIISTTKIFHVGSLSLTDEPSRSTTLYALDLAKNSGAIISYDPNYRASLWPNFEQAKQQLRIILPFVNLLKLAEEETEILTDETDPSLAAKKLVEAGISCVVVTLGERGALVCTKKGQKEVPAQKVENIVDTTGAGDAFWGAFLKKMIDNNVTHQNLSLEQAIEFAQFGNKIAAEHIKK
ncbi:MAG: carbohydrate kinase [Firmicutes bacterium]|jgi:fructokinase|nr:carbohydrate kinase [Bacillota bacterium]